MPIAQHMGEANELFYSFPPCVLCLSFLDQIKSDTIQGYFTIYLLCIFFQLAVYLLFDVPAEKIQY